MCVVAMLTDGWYLGLKGRGGGEVIVVVKGKETMTSSGGLDSGENGSRVTVGVLPLSVIII